MVILTSVLRWTPCQLLKRSRRSIKSTARGLIQSTRNLENSYLFESVFENCHLYSSCHFHSTKNPQWQPSSILKGEGSQKLEHIHKKLGEAINETSQVFSDSWNQMKNLRFQLQLIFPLQLLIFSNTNFKSLGRKFNCLLGIKQVPDRNRQLSFFFKIRLWLNRISGMTKHAY